MGYCPLSYRQGSGQVLGARLGAQAGRAARWWALGWARRWALGERACWVCRASVRVGGAGRARGWALGRQALGRAGSGKHGRAERHDMAYGTRRQLGRRAHGRAQQARARQGAAGARTRDGRVGVRGRRRQGRAGRPAGRPVRAWCAQLGQVGCFAAPDSVFGLVRLGIFPESPNEHCSL